MRTGGFWGIPASSLVGAIVLVLNVTSVRAQERWAVVAVGNAVELERSRDAVASVRSALEFNALDVLEAEEARERVEAESTEMARASPAILGTLGTSAETALEHVALGESEAAIRLADTTLAELDGYIEAVGTLPQARDVANLCLYAARAELSLQRDADARSRVQSCFHLVPNLEVDRGTNPPEIVQLVEEVRSEIESSSSVLSIRALGLDDARTCDIRVQGRVIGRAPTASIALVPGNYGVQVDCAEGRMGRVHHVEMVDSPVRVELPVELDRSLHSDGELGLEWSDQAGVELNQLVSSLVRTLNVPRVLTVHAGPSELVLRSFSMASASVRELRRVSLALPYEQSQVQGAVTALLGEGGEIELTGGGGLGPVGIAGLVIGGVGVLSGIGSVVAGLVSQERFDQVNSECGSETLCSPMFEGDVEDGEALQLTSIALTSVAAVALVSGVVLLAVELSSGEDDSSSTSLLFTPSAVYITGVF